MPIPDWILPSTGLGGVLAFLITGFAKGWLYTSKQVDKMAQQYEDEIKRLDGERVEWKDIAMAGIHVTAQTAPALNALVEGQHTIKGVLEAIRGPGHE